jgi:hypothetical protein
MRVVCAWCRQEGRPGLLSEREPLDDPAETHGICHRHSGRVLQSVPSVSFPGVRLLVVVSPSEPRLLAYLEAAFATLPYVRVIQDRRRGERRVEAAPACADRRRRERRVRAPEMSLLGYQLVRFGTGRRDPS